MESKEQTELTSKIETDSEREEADSSWGEGWGVEGSNPNQKELVNKDNRVVTAGGGG